MIFFRLKEQIHSICDLLSRLTDEQYNKKVFHLANATIGGHARHIIELVQCAVKGYQSGKIDYENRLRDFELETKKHIAQEALLNLLTNLEQEDKHLILYDVDDNPKAIQPISTTYFREVVYITEHTIHHLALIGVALKEMKLELTDQSFGMAYATIKFNQEKSYQQK